MFPKSLAMQRQHRLFSNRFGSQGSIHKKRQPLSLLGKELCMFSLGSQKSTLKPQTFKCTRVVKDCKVLELRQRKQKLPRRKYLLDHKGHLPNFLGQLGINRLFFSVRCTLNKQNFCLFPLFNLLNWRKPTLTCRAQC